MIDLVRQFKNRAATFERAAHDLLGRHETSPSRVISLLDTRKRLRGLTLEQESLLQESLTAVERGLYRSAHVMAWAAFMDFLEQRLDEDGLAKVHKARPAWGKHTTVEDLRENIAEYQILEVAREIGLLKKAEAKALQGLLSKRNECAHPSSYQPGLNESLGYASELLARIEQVQGRKL